MLKVGGYEMVNQHIKQSGKLEYNPSSGSLLRTTWLKTIFFPVNFFLPVNKNDTSESDSPGQVVETEDIVKPLDTEQVDETTTNTTEPTNGMVYSSQIV